MDPVTTAVTLADWLADAYLRSVVITCFLSGAAVGFFLSRPAFEFFRWNRDFNRRCRREDEEDRRKRQEEQCRAAEKQLQKAEAERRESEARGRYFAGIYFDESGAPSCPVCRLPLHACGRSSELGERFYGTCPKCDKEFHSNCTAEIIFSRIRELKRQ